MEHLIDQNIGRHHDDFSASELGYTTYGIPWGGYYEFDEFGYAVRRKDDIDFDS